MASPTTPTHGKLGAIYRLRPNGFEGDGLNDVTWGTAYSGGGTSGYFEVVIMAEAVPDTYKWRKNGGAWDDNTAAGYAITGAAQTLSDGQTITFAATTGHTLADSWSIGNLDTEATTEVAAAAQITAATHRLLNPNATITWTDSGSKTVLITEHTIGKATFTGNVTVVTVSGNNGFVLESALEKVGYLIDWNLNITLDTAEISRMGQHWKEFIPGQAGATGGANAYFIGSESFFDAFKDAADGNQKYFLLQLFNYDPDQDQTGDHFMAWVTFTTFTVNAAVGDAVKESIGFQVFGTPSFTAQD